MESPKRSNALDALMSMFPEGSSDLISLDTAFEAAGRTSYSNETNRVWLFRKLPELKRRELIEPVYDHAGKKRLKGLKLTNKGREFLGRPTRSSRSVLGMSMDEVAQAVADLKKRSPDFNITFIIEPK
jgi:hypothetical protein